jgi:asparagine N-glycosylation enzyme membrane subunit Stt3
MNKAAFVAGIVFLAFAVSAFAMQNISKSGISPGTSGVFLDLPLAVLGSLLVALSSLAHRHAVRIALVTVIVLVLMYLSWLGFRLSL